MTITLSEPGIDPRSSVPHLNTAVWLVKMDTEIGLRDHPGASFCLKPIVPYRWAGLYWYPVKVDVLPCGEGLTSEDTLTEALRRIREVLGCEP